MGNLSTILTEVFGLKNGTLGTSLIYPALAGSVVPTAGVGAYVLGAYSQIVAASVIGSAMLTGVVLAVETVDSDGFQFQVAQGGAGAETAVWWAAFRQKRTSDVGYDPGLYFPVVPARQLTTNARLSVAVASGGGSNASLGFWLIVTPRPF